METYLNEQEMYLLWLRVQASELKGILEKKYSTVVKEKDEKAVYVYSRLSGIRSPNNILQVLSTDLGTALLDIENALEAVEIARRVLLEQE